MQQLKYVVVVVALAVSGCGGCDSLRTVVVPAEKEIEVPRSAAILPGNALVPDDVFPADQISALLAEAITQSFDTSGYDKDAVDSLILTKMKMTVTEPNEGGRQVRGLGFLQKLTIAVGADGVEFIVAADSADAAFDGEPGPVDYDMPLTDAELKPAFVAADQMDMKADLVPSDPPNFATTVLFETELTILVNVFGALN